MRYEHGANRDGKLVYVKAEIVPRRRRVRVRARRRSSATPARMGIGPYVVAERRSRRLRRLHQQPALRRDARVRLGAGGVRLRGADGQARRRARHGPGRVPPAATPCSEGVGHAAPARSIDCAGAGRRAAAPVEAMPLPPERVTASERRPARSCPAAWPTPPTARASPRRRLRRRRTRTSASPRASTTTRPPGCGWRSSAASRSSTVHTAAAEVGQGLVTVEQQICPHRARRRAT